MTTEIFASQKGNVTYKELFALAEAGKFADKPVSIEIRQWDYNDVIQTEEYNPVAVILYHGEIPALVIGDITAQDLEEDLPVELPAEEDDDDDLEEAEINETTTLSGNEVFSASGVVAEAGPGHEHLFWDQYGTATAEGGKKFKVYSCVGCDQKKIEAL